MKRHSRQNQEIRDFILKKVASYPDSIVPFVVKVFDISRTAANRYMQRLVEEGILIAEGKTKARRYSFRKIVDVTFTIELSMGLPEDVIWRYHILPHVKNVKRNILDICQYGFTEMLNNAIDHSASPHALITYEQTYEKITMVITDYGVGIFEKIQRDFRLSDPRHALLELSKGKLTSSPKKHSGEGVFFTSRMFDEFYILSGNLFYSKRREGSESLIGIEDRENYVKGTYVKIAISPHADWTMRDVFNRFQGDSLRFRKTHVPIKLGQYPGEQLVSRSQAKRILVRFDVFSEILLDFEGVQEIGQPFADEIFRVYKNDHPAVKITAINTTPEIEQMITYVQNALPG